SWGPGDQFRGDGHGVARPLFHFAAASARSTPFSMNERASLVRGGLSGWLWASDSTRRFRPGVTGTLMDSTSLSARFFFTRGIAFSFASVFLIGPVRHGQPSAQPIARFEC